MNNMNYIDISVPYHKQVEGPLGGVSVEYIIKVTAQRNLFDKNYNASGIINYQISKSFRECEDFWIKLLRKYPEINFPKLPKSLSDPATSAEERTEALRNFMKFISSLPEVASSSAVVQFLGIKLQQLEEKIVQEDDIDNSTTIFKKIKIKPKKISSDIRNSNETIKISNTSNNENDTSNSFSEEEQDKDIFTQSKKRNDTGSRPLFDENSINQRSEKLNESKPTFDPQDNVGAFSTQGSSILLIPEAKHSNFLLLQTENTEDTSDLFNFDDNIDQLLKDIGNNKLTKQKQLTSQVSQKKPAKPPVPLKPIPVARSQMVTRPDSSSVLKPRPTPRPRNMSKMSVSDSKHIKDIDILKYIQNEQNSNKNEPDLFL